MPSSERLINFPAKTTPTGSDVVYLADMSNSGSEVKSTVTQVVAATVGSQVQAFDAGLQSISGLTTAADKMIYTTAPDTYATTTLTAAARTVLDDTTTAAMLTTLGAQPVDAALTSIASLTTGANQMIYTTAADTYATSGITALGRAIANAASEVALLNDLGIIFGNTGAAWGGGSASHTFTGLTGVTASMNVVATLLSSTNPTPVLYAVAGNDQITVTFVGDPGANTVVQFIAIG